MKNRFTKFFVFLLMFALAVNVSAVRAESAPATPTDLSDAPENTQEENGDSAEILITKTVRTGGAWKGKTSDTRPAVLKLDVARPGTVYLTAEGKKGIRAAVVKADRPERELAKASSDPETGLMILSWKAEAASYLITVAPKTSGNAEVSVRFFDEEGYAVWADAQKAAQLTEASEQAAKEEEQDIEAEPNTEDEQKAETEQNIEDPVEAEQKDEGKQTAEEPEQLAEEPAETQRAAEPEQASEAPEEPAQESEPQQMAEDPAEAEQVSEAPEEPEQESEPEQTAEDPAEAEQAQEPEQAGKEPAKTDETGEESARPDETEEQGAGPERQAERSVRIALSWDTDEPQYGDTAHFSSILTGYDRLTYSLQWQSSRDREIWTDYPGATEPQLDIAVTEDLNGVYFRLLVYVEEDRD